ncbi:MAG TPA: peptide ABC transporter substrate-binding protein, partial [Dehalococcoidia bacterium]|nr:peptide ABC transporter substrate-binding protein [Dehalococcoidia bacterium]
TDRDLATLVFSGLTRLGLDGQVLPDLAESWQITPDGRSVTFKLRSGVVWHTGSPFTAADVVFTYNLLADPKLQADPDQAPLWRQVHCSDPDPLTVTCELPAPFAPFLAFTTVGILPRHILEGADSASLLDNAFNKNPIGTGPYRLAQLDDNRAVLKANAQYHMGAPKIDEIDFQFYPDNASAASAIVRGDADGLLLEPSVSRAEADELTSRSGMKVYNANRSAYTVLYLNNGQPPLNDVAVRRAIAQSIDINSIISDVLGSAATAATSPMVPGTWAFNPDIQSYDHDADAARKSLDDAGWTLADGSDVRQKDGVELRISLVTDQDPLRGAVADRIAGELTDSGIATTVVRQDSSDLVKDALIPRQYQAAIFGWDPGPDPDPYPAWHSSQATDNGRNIAAYRSEDADRIMEQARRTSDIDERQSLYYTFQQTFHDDVPSIVLYYPVFTYVVSDKVRGIEMGTLFNTGSRFRNVHEWTLEEAPLGGG